MDSWPACGQLRGYEAALVAPDDEDEDAAELDPDEEDEPDEVDEVDDVELLSLDFDSELLDAFLPLASDRLSVR